MDARQVVFAEMVKVAKAAIDQGNDGILAVLKTFPGTPQMVAAEAWCEADMGKTEEFRKSIEQTIDLTIIQDAIEKAAEKGAA